MWTRELRGHEQCDQYHHPPCMYKKVTYALTMRERVRQRE